MEFPLPVGFSVRIEAVFAGQIGRLANDGSDTAIDKRAVAGRRWLDRNGLDGDTVADRYHHGGPDRALNHYPAEHYACWQRRYPGFENIFVPGVLGENISSHDLTEADVCVGDVFTLGEATIQITQPRQPCWKIGARTGIAGLARAVVTEGRAGWFYRVIEPGYVQMGDRLTRSECANHGITLAQMWTLQTSRRIEEADRKRMMTLAELPTLAPGWRKRLASRARQLAERGRH